MAVSARDNVLRIIDDRFPIRSRSAAALLLRRWARRQFQDEGICVLPGFLEPLAVESICREIEPLIDAAFWSATHSSIYLRSGDPAYPVGHPCREELLTRMGTLAQDQLPPESALRRLHACAEFRAFIGAVVGAPRLYEYADGLTSINVLIFRHGDQLGWHFDESEYAITLMLKPASRGGRFEYAPGLREAGSENHAALRSVVAGDGNIFAVDNPSPGSLVLFRGDQSLHRVTPVEIGGPRMVAVLSYDNQPGMYLSEHDRLLLYGRIR